MGFCKWTTNRDKRYILLRPPPGPGVVRPTVRRGPAPISERSGTGRGGAKRRRRGVRVRRLPAVMTCPWRRRGFPQRAHGKPLETMGRKTTELRRWTFGRYVRRVATIANHRKRWDAKLIGGYIATPVKALGPAQQRGLSEERRGGNQAPCSSKEGRRQTGPVHTPARGLRLRPAKRARGERSSIDAGGTLSQRGRRAARTPPRRHTSPAAGYFASDTLQSKGEKYE